MLSNLLFLALTYLISGIPFGLLIGKLFYGKDIRLEGSGNIGATNVFRTCSKVAGVFTFFLDGLKGAIPVFIAKLIFQNQFHLIVGIFAILGHIFPIYLKFKGGKGVATTILVLVSISWEFGLIGVIIWLIFLLIFGFVSLASIAMSILLLPFAFIIGGFSLGLFNLIFASLILFKHKENITRLMNKQEKKMFKKSLL